MEKNEEVENLIDNSGMITHYKVINYLREKGWKLLISPYYYDNISETIREVDVIAEKQFSSSGRFSDSNIQFNVQLFLECKYIKQNIVFWFDNKDKTKAVERLEKDTGRRILYNKSSADILPDSFHYFRSDKVAKLFSTNTNREDVVYKAFTQCLNAVIYYDQNYHRPIFFPFKKNSNSRVIPWPVVICDNFRNFFEADFTGTPYEYKEMKENFQLEINYTYLDKSRVNSVSDYFLIDFVDFSDLEVFLNNIDGEMEAIINSF